MIEIITLQFWMPLIQIFAFVILLFTIAYIIHKITDKED